MLAGPLWESSNGLFRGIDSRLKPVRHENPLCGSVSRLTPESISITSLPRVRFHSPVSAIALIGICFIRRLPARLCTHRCPDPVTELRHSSTTIISTHPNSDPSSYIEDGYNITLTDAPKDLGGRLRLNCARTTPELPGGSVSLNSSINYPAQHTMWPGNLAPNDSNL